jgi:hypothetical protein
VITEEWSRRVVAEYASASIVAELLHWLIRLGVSPDTLQSCHRIVADELAHAELSREVYLEAGGDPAAIPIDERDLVIPHRPGAPLLERALFLCADFLCCGETVARPLFRAMLAEAKVPVAARALERVLKDEARHSAFGWSLLDELLPRADHDLRARLRAAAPELMARVADGYTFESPRPGDIPDDEARAWGLITPEQYTEIATRAVPELLEPRFARAFNATAG